MDDAVQQDLPAVLAGIAKQREENIFAVERMDIVEACRRLQAQGFEHLTCITAIDWKRHWEVVYHLAKFGRRELVTLRVQLPRHDPSIPSVAGLWIGAGWHERECYDLMGIAFIGTPDPRRILLPEDFGQHPLRKEVKYGNRS